METRLNTDLDKKIKDYLEGKLSAPQIDGLWADILANPEYLAHLKTEAQLKSYFEKERMNRVGPARHKYRKQALMVLAAIILMTAGLFWYKISDTGSGEFGALAEISVTDLETPDITRSENDQYHPAGLMLIDAFDMVLDGNTDQAALLMREIISEFPDTDAAAKASLNLGILAYNDTNFELAVHFFREARSGFSQQPGQKQKALWFLANAALRAGQKELAADAALEASGMDGFYTGVSRRMHEALADPR